jgi:ParB/RepB/Spo0J family partition protein
MARVKGQAEIEKKNQVLEQLKIVYVDIESIQPNEYNPNRQSEHDFELLCRSMREDGFTQPIIVQEATNKIVDGEHRWRAAHKLGFKTIPVVFVNMTPEQMRIATLRHNRARGSEDVELSAQVLRDLQQLGALDWAQDSLMISDEELNRLIEDIPAPEALASEEYGQGWEPTDVHENEAAKVEQGEQTTQARTTTDSQGGVYTVAMTDKAIQATREREAKIKQAKTEEEKAMVMQETKMHRVSLIFNGEEAELVKTVLGEKPAEQMVELCRFWQENH